MFTICSRARNRKRNRKLQIRNQNQPLTDDLVRLLPKAELLNETVFASLADARRRLSIWRYDYNNIRPHSALNGQSPATARRALELFDGSAPDALAKPKRMSYSAAGLT
jgi:transposase InsO family protein